MAQPQVAPFALAFSCGERSAFKPKGNDYLRSRLARLQLQGLVKMRSTLVKISV